MASRFAYTVDPVRAAQARAAKSLTQADAADLLRVNRVTLNKIENGRANVSLELLERMTELYDRSRDWLLGNDEALDPIEAGRKRIAAALEQISAGFEDLNEVLGDRVREAREVQQTDDAEVEVVA